MKKKRIIKLCCFGLVFILLLGVISRFLQVNSLADAVRVKGFYMEPENSLDMVTIGASETYTSIAPGILWKEYGFTSYNYSIAGCPVSMVKSQVREVLAHQKPKVLVIEVNGAVPENGAYQTQDKRLRKYIDNMPWSENKIETIKEVVPEEEQESYFFPFLKYHSNWKNLQICGANLYLQAKMILNGGSRLKGFQTVPQKAEIKKELVDITIAHSTAPLAKEAEYYLRDLLQYLKDEKIDNVIFVRIPHRVTEKTYGDYQRSNRAGEIVKEYGFPYVNFELEKEAIKLDMAEDFYNDSHMNLYGQEKFTRYLGEYLVKHYELKNCAHSEEITKAWNEAAEETNACIIFGKTLLEEGKRRTLNEGWRETKKYNLEY